MAALQLFLTAEHSSLERLPTPVHFDKHSLLSPPLSRAPSPRPSPTSPPADVSSTDGSVSPLPSPVARHVGKKTSAFFGSPFDRSPSPPALSSPEPSVADHVEPERNLSFFFAKGSATPTPPPSTRSSRDEGDDPVPSRSPPPTRFFPSRSTTEHDPDCFNALRDHKAPSRAAFVTLDASLRPITDDVQTSSPTSFADLSLTDPPTPKEDEERDSSHTHHHDHDLLQTRNDIVQGSIVGDDVPLTLVRELGNGSFSTVWLALDMEHKLEGHRGPTRLRSQSIARKKGDRVVQGLKPQMASGASLSRSHSIFLAPRHGEGATALADEEAVQDVNDDGRRLVAIKMMDRAMCDANDRTRISFVREVEVLRHISHPSIVSYLHSFTTPTRHCLVLEAILGGELFEILDQGDNHLRMTEPLLRRIFGELCQAVGWMHGVGLVHRDIKLENILLTANPFVSSPVNLCSLPSPLVKLTDFGLARFIDPAAPDLTTRCGSESYAAPEIVTRKTYDGRQTDAWACGVVLYALATRALPFDRARGERDSRRAYLIRIAQGDYTWPEPQPPLATEGLKSVVARLLVRDTARRARVVELWDEEWMRGDGAPTPPLSRAGTAISSIDSSGRLVGKDIPSVAKQEL